MKKDHAKTKGIYYLINFFFIAVFPVIEKFDTIFFVLN